MSRIWQQVQTLRAKITLLYVAVFGAILAVLSLTVITVRDRQLREDFDERLADRAQAMVDAIEIAEEAGATTRRPRRLNPFRFPGYYFQLRAASGEVLERSNNLQDAELPFTPKARESKQTQAAVLETLDREEAVFLRSTSQAARLLTLYNDEPPGEPYFLQVAVSLARVDESIAALWRLSLVMVPAGLAMAALAAWFLARRSFGPIGKIAQEARELSVAHLDRRIPPPAGKDEVAEMVQTLNEMLDRLENAFKGQERFIANAAHELRSPIAVLLGEAQVLSQKARSPEEYQRFVASVQDEMRRLGQLVNSLLTLARADAGISPTAAAAVALNDIVTDAVQATEPQARQREVRLVTKLALPDPEQPEPLVLGDAELLHVMLTNLIRNAIRYSPVDSTVEIDVTLNSSEATLAVRDSGPGIPGEHIDHIFDRFYSAPVADGKSAGAGLGLAIAKGVLQLHHGTIAVHNREPSGCEFQVCLPLYVPDGV
jgi:heavy metal sensor kinase